MKKKKIPGIFKRRLLVYSNQDWQTAFYTILHFIIRVFFSILISIYQIEFFNKKKRYKKCKKLQ